MEPGDENLRGGARGGADSRREKRRQITFGWIEGGLI
jgi:hypothetical protein